MVLFWYYRSYFRGGQPWHSNCFGPTSPIRNCKTDHLKHDSQKQRHDGICGFTAAEMPTPVLILFVDVHLAI